MNTSNASSGTASAPRGGPIPVRNPQRYPSGPDRQADLPGVAVLIGGGEPGDGVPAARQLPGRGQNAGRRSGQAGHVRAVERPNTNGNRGSGTRDGHLAAAGLFDHDHVLNGPAHSVPLPARLRKDAPSVPRFDISAPSV